MRGIRFLATEMRTTGVARGVARGVAWRLAFWCLPLLAVAAVLLFLAYRTASTSTVTATATSLSHSIERILVNDLWPAHGAFLTGDAAVKQKPGAPSPEAIAIRDRVMTLAGGTELVKLKIYNLDGITVFSSDFSQLGADYSMRPAFIEAVSGLESSETSFRETFEAMDGPRVGIDLVGTYLPVYDPTDPQSIIAVMEIYQDITAIAGDVRTGPVIAVLLAITVLVIGATYAILGWVAHTTERRFAEEQRRRREADQRTFESAQANHAKSEFLAHMSHELRTPLNAIIGFSEIISSQAFGPSASERYGDYAKDINNAGQHLLAVINDVLDLAKVEAGRMAAKMDIHAGTPVFSSAVSLSRDGAETDAARIVVDIEPNLPSLRTDAVKLRQIVLNIVSNARKFTPMDGRIQVTARRAPATNGIIFECRDTGIGMTPDEIAVALTPFGQVKSIYTTDRPGTGLGLPLTKQLVELVGGTFELESQKDVGTTVRCVFPAMADNDDQPSDGIALAMAAE